MIVDGIGVAGGMLPVPLDPATLDGQAGIWTQGAAIELRRIAVYALPAHDQPRSRAPGGSHRGSSTTSAA